MALITTKTVGIPSQADPKPTVALDYAGQPIKPGDYYNGRPEHQNPHIHPEQQVQPSTDVPSVHLVMSPAQKRSKSWTAQRRAEFGQRMRNYWLQRKANQDQPKP